MPVNRELWEDEYFLEDEFPHWNCPGCGKGIIHLDGKTLFVQETAKSKGEQKEPDTEIDQIRETYSAQFICSNPKCKDRIMMTGQRRPEEEWDDHGRSKYYAVYFPKSIYPAPHIIKLPEYTPFDVEEVIEKSFELFWADSSACANAIRKVVDLILDDRGIKRYNRTGKRIEIRLHKRIELLSVKYPEAAETLEAIKWIGNAGSHEIEIDRENVLVAYDLLESALIQLYDESHEKKLKRIQKQINKKKKPLH